MPCSISCSAFAAVISAIRWPLPSRIPLTSESRIRSAPSVAARAVAAWSALTFISSPSSVTPIELTTGRNPPSSSMLISLGEPGCASPTCPSSSSSWVTFTLSPSPRHRPTEAIWCFFAHASSVLFAVPARAPVIISIWSAGVTRRPFFFFTGRLSPFISSSTTQPPPCTITSGRWCDSR